MDQIMEGTPPKVQAEIRKFPVPGSSIEKILNDAVYRQQFHARLKRYNPMIAFFYRIGLLPLFGASRSVMVLTTQGNKSGKLRSIPIGYVRIGGKIYLISAWGKRTSWYKNLVAHPREVWIQIGMHKSPARADVLEDEIEIEGVLGQFVTESPAQAHLLFGWEPDRDRMENADFSEVTSRVVFVLFTEKTDKSQKTTSSSPAQG